ncbi:porin family protein [Flavitalea sp.]|nr:hypothetical protein [Flavitalea sp.]
MNEHHPYDQLLRDKLNRLPVPDVQKTWPEMRMLLDKEMPEGGRSRRRGGWWFFSAILIFIIAGSWTLLTLNFSKQNVDPPLSATKSKLSPPGTGPGTDKAKAGTLKDSEKPRVEDDKILLSKEEGPDNNENSNQPLAVRTVKEGEQTKSIPDGTGPAVINPGIGDKSIGDKSIGDMSAGEKATGSKATEEKATGSKAIGERAIGDRTTGDKSTEVKAPGDRSRGAKSTGAKSMGEKSTGEKAIIETATGNNRSTTREKGNSKNSPDPGSSDKSPGAIVGLTTDPSASIKSPSVSTTAVDGFDEKQKGLTAAAISEIESLHSASFAETIDSINKDYGSYITYAPVSRKYYRQNKKYGRPANVRAPYTTVGRNFAIGLSLPLVFPLGDQQALSYNVNAGPNTATDYIPAPHAQYHFNGKVYLQSELQVLSPQYIKPALLYQSKTSNNFYQTTSSVSAQKLYYFNVPVSLHYSPFKHFYMGTGLQFSSLLSGVAMHEQQRTGMVSSDSIYTVSYSKFSNDSISNKLSGSEMRLMLDANYYWNKFTVGLRYNQALSNYVSTRAAPSVPLTVDKNKSLQFYLRYNLWEDKKRKNVGSQTLAAK